MTPPEGFFKYCPLWKVNLYPPSSSPPNQTSIQPSQTLNAGNLKKTRAKGQQGPCVYKYRKCQLSPTSAPHALNMSRPQLVLWAFPLHDNEGTLTHKYTHTHTQIYTPPTEASELCHVRTSRRIKTEAEQQNRSDSRVTGTNLRSETHRDRGQSEKNFKQSS